MEYEKIKQLIQDMSNSKLTALDIDFPDGTKVSMKKENSEFTDFVERKENIEALKGLISSKAEDDVKISNLSSIENNTEFNCNIVKSPMVGTFYIKHSPTEKPYVEVGTEVKKGDTLCIIEAMKLMNEIESEFTGKIKEILLRDGEPVEYGTELFVISND